MCVVMAPTVDVSSGTGCRGDALTVSPGGLVNPSGQHTILTWPGPWEFIYSMVCCEAHLQYLLNVL